MGGYAENIWVNKLNHFVNLIAWLKNLLTKCFLLLQKRYPMELHAVHFNTKYGSNLHEALANSGNAYNTLAVLGVMFEVQEEDNPLLKPIVDGEALIN